MLAAHTGKCYTCFIDIKAHSDKALYGHKKAFLTSYFQCNKIVKTSVRKCKSA